MENNRNGSDLFWNSMMFLTLLGALAGFCLLIAVIYWLADIITFLNNYLQQI